VPSLGRGAVGRNLTPRQGCGRVSSMASANHPTRDDIDLVSGDFYGSDPHEQIHNAKQRMPLILPPEAVGAE
jgi:hypothetical protein